MQGIGKNQTLRSGLGPGTMLKGVTLRPPKRKANRACFLCDVETGGEKHAILPGLFDCSIDEESVTDLTWTWAAVLPFRGGVVNITRKTGGLFDPGKGVGKGRVLWNACGRDLERLNC